MNAAIDRTEDNGSGVKFPAVDLTTIAQLKKALTDLGCRSVNFIEEEDNGLGTGPYKRREGP